MNWVVVALMFFTSFILSLYILLWILCQIILCVVREEKKKNLVYALYGESAVVKGMRAYMLGEIEVAGASARR